MCYITVEQIGFWFLFYMFLVDLFVVCLVDLFVVCLLIKQKCFVEAFESHMLFIFLERSRII